MWVTIVKFTYIKIKLDNCGERESLSSENLKSLASVVQQFMYSNNPGKFKSLKAT